MKTYKITNKEAGKIPDVPIKYLKLFLEQRGFRPERQNGSHVIWRNDVTNQSFPVASHSGRELHPIVLKNVLRAMGVQFSEFRSWYDDARRRKLASTEPKKEVAFTILYDGENVLLLKRSDECKHSANLWNPPGGHLKENEEPMVAAIRECEEESGVTPKELKLFKEISDEHGKAYIFVSKSHDGEVKINSESKEFAWVPVHTLRDYEMMNLFKPMGDWLT